MKTETGKGSRRVARDRTGGGVDVGYMLTDLAARVAALEVRISELVRACEPRGEGAGKEFYTTADLARVKGVSVFTVTARWCNPGRIEAFKDEETGRWKIPAHEYGRLVRGGSLRPRSG